MSDVAAKSPDVLVILAEFTVPDAARTEFLAGVAADADGSVSDEPGCRQFDVLAPQDGSQTITLLEIYDGADAFETHLRTPHYARFDAVVKRLGLTPPTVRKLSRLHQGARGTDA